MTKKEYDIIQSTLAQYRRDIIEKLDDMKNELDALLEVENLEEDKF